MSTGTGRYPSSVNSSAVRVPGGHQQLFARPVRPEQHHVRPGLLGDREEAPNAAGSSTSGG